MNDKIRAKKYDIYANTDLYQGGDIVNSVNPSSEISPLASFALTLNL